GSHMVKVCLFVADGTDEIEFSAPWGIFKRAEIPIDSVYVGENKDRLVKMSRDVEMYANRSYKEIPSADDFAKQYDIAIIPGGGLGAKTLSTTPFVQQVVKEFYKKPNKWIGMICAGPLTAKTSGLPNKQITGHPSVRGQLEEGGYKYLDQPVVLEENLITSQGPGTAMLFGLKLLEQVASKDKYNAVYKSLSMP
uniref:Uncharacterized protein C22E12.03c n=1 Tax=Schizosaccharomyces pombe TaxID=4896 RepID=UPI0002782C4A